MRLYVKDMIIRGHMVYFPMIKSCTITYFRKIFSSNMMCDATNGRPFSDRVGLSLHNIPYISVHKEYYIYYPYRFIVCFSIVVLKYIFMIGCPFWL